MDIRQITGRVWLFGDNVDTDLIYPVTFLFSTKGGITDKEEIKKQAMAGVDPDFVSKVTPGDIIVAGDNFGCGSHREQAVTSLLYAGVNLIIARSFARLYYRNAINIGLPVVEWANEGPTDVEQGDILQVNLLDGLVQNTARGTRWLLKPIPTPLFHILSEGGLVARIKAQGIQNWWQTV